VTAYHYGQIVLALGVLALVGKRVHEVFFEAGRFDKRLGEAILASLRAGETARARALAAGGGEAWEARIGRAAFDAYDRGVDVGATVEEVIRASFLLVSPTLFLVEIGTARHSRCLRRLLGAGCWQDDQCEQQGCDGLNKRSPVGVSADRGLHSTRAILVWSHLVNLVSVW